MADPRVRGVNWQVLPGLETRGRTVPRARGGIVSPFKFRPPGGFVIWGRVWSGWPTGVALLFEGQIMPKVFAGSGWKTM